MGLFAYIKSLFCAKWRMLRRIDEFMQREDMQRFHADIFGEELYLESTLFSSNSAKEGSVIAEHYNFRAVCGFSVSYVRDSYSGKARQSYVITRLDQKELVRIGFEEGCKFVRGIIRLDSGAEISLETEHTQLSDRQAMTTMLYMKGDCGKICMAENSQLEDYLCIIRYLPGAVRKCLVRGYKHL